MRWQAGRYQRTPIWYQEHHHNKCLVSFSWLLLSRCLRNSICFVSLLYPSELQKAFQLSSHFMYCSLLISKACSTLVLWLQFLFCFHRESLKWIITTWMEYQHCLQNYFFPVSLSLIVLILAVTFPQITAWSTSDICLCSVSEGSSEAQVAVAKPMYRYYAIC